MDKARKLAIIHTKLSAFFRKVDHDGAGLVDRTVFEEMLRLHRVLPDHMVGLIQEVEHGKVSYDTELARVIGEIESRQSVAVETASIIDWDSSSLAGSIRKTREADARSGTMSRLSKGVRIQTRHSLKSQSMIKPIQNINRYENRSNDSHNEMEAKTKKAKLILSEFKYQDPNPNQGSG